MRLDRFPRRLGCAAFIAALSFILFGLWTIRGDTLEGEDAKASRFGPVLTVGIAFFLAEMGDKTQLATVSLAVQYGNALAVLAGTTLAMVVADAFGIVVGIVMRRHIPARAIKWFSAVVFILFGLFGVYTMLSARLSIAYVWGILAVIIACTAYGMRALSGVKKPPLEG